MSGDYIPPTFDLPEFPRMPEPTITYDVAPFAMLDDETGRWFAALRIRSSMGNEQWRRTESMFDTFDEAKAFAEAQAPKELEWIRGSLKIAIEALRSRF